MSDAAIQPRSTNYTIYLLLVIYTLSYLDRQIMNIVAEPVKNELNLADWQLGLLAGLAFALFYTVLGIPLAQYSDRSTTQRGKLIAVCLVSWSVMTALCGAAQNFVQLALARVGVGVGEAGCNPAAHSLISDIVPREKRASAIGIYSLGVPLGKLFGLLVGGMVAHALGWRMSFLVFGIPGIILAVVAWYTLKDPRTYAPHFATTRAAPQGSMYVAAWNLFKTPSFLYISLGGGFMAFLSQGQIAFLGSFVIRVYGLDVGQAGIVLGLALGGGGAMGTWLGGFVADHFGKKDGRAYALVPTFAAIVGGSLFVGALLAPSLWPAIILLTIATALTSVWFGPVWGTVQNLFPAGQRGMAAAVHLLIANLIGFGLGPLTFGIFSDLANHGFSIGPLVLEGAGSAEGLRRGMVVAGIGTVCLAVTFFLICARTLRKDLNRMATMQQ